MTHWLQVKPMMLPSISNEIRNKISEFHALVEEVDAAEETDHNRWAELLQDYSRLRSTMKARMLELQLFYEENLDDEKIIFFEQLRLKIKKALHNRPGKKNLMEKMN
jgi:hypothetical protein